MSHAREIRHKIRSIENTRTITRAMEMVAASKMRQAQERMQKTRPYAEKILQVIGHVACASSEYRHPFLEAREAINRVGCIVISSERGLCGGLNNNLFRQLLVQIQQWQTKQISVELALIGHKAQSFFKRLNLPIVAVESDLGDMPNLVDILGVVQTLLARYEAKAVDALYVVYNQFQSMLRQQPMIFPLLPLNKPEQSAQHRWDYLYEPDAQMLLDRLLTRYIESEVYQAVVENIACEQAARRVAMQNASDNALSIIKEFKLAYNKARQAGITQEIAEIVTGAAII